MDYGEILANAWKIIWKHKVLWIFGFLASCGSGTGGSSGGGTSSTSSGSGFDPGKNELLQGFEQFFSQAGDFFERIPPDSYILVAILTIITILVLSVVVTVISSFGKAGLVHGVLQADDGAEKLDFSSLFNSGMENLLNVFLIHLLESLASVVIIIVIIGSAALVGILSFGIGLFCMIPLICLLIPVFWAATVWVRMAVVSAVSHKTSVIDSYRSAWKLVRKNLGPVALITLILFIGGSLANALISLPMILIAFPMIIGLAGGVISGSGAVMGTGLTVGIVGCCIYMPVLIVLTSALQSYIWAGWTLTFRRLTGMDIDLPLLDETPDALLIDDNH
jgi:hypothetical protein